ncbi:MAG: glycosyltransferase family 4 protein [Acidobacteriota bacterium]
MRILFVSTRPPWPYRRGDQARVAGWISQLATRHDVAVVCQRPPGFPPTPFPDRVHGGQVALSGWRMGRSLTQGWRWPLQVAMHYQPELARRINETVEAFRPDVAVIVLSRLGWLVPALRGVPVVLDLVDSLALNMRRRAARQPLLKPFWRLEARRIERWDRYWIGQVAAALAVSAEDRKALIEGSPELGERIAVVPFGISLPVSMPTPSADQPIVLLSGNLGYFPTHDGALWLAREVWPRVRQACPQAEWWLAGSRPPRDLQRLRNQAGIRLVIDPDDLTVIRRQVTVAVAPMRSGSGTPIKVLEAMADGLPVVATPEAAAGLDGVGRQAIAVAAEASAFADAIVRLIEDASAARRQAEAAWTWLQAQHDLSHSTRCFEDVLEGVVGKVSAERRQGRR